MTAISGKLQLIDHGIDDIVRRREAEFEPINPTALPPAQSAARPELERLIALPSLEDYLSRE